MSDELKLVIGVIGGVLTFVVGERLLMLAALYWTEKAMRRPASAPTGSEGNGD